MYVKKFYILSFHPTRNLIICIHNINKCITIINFFQVNDPEFDKQFLIALACLKSENPNVYNEKVKFFNDSDKPGTSESAKVEEKEKRKSKKEKPLFLRDYERKIILEKDGRFSSSEDEDDVKQKAKSKMPTYAEEQKELKDSFKQALKDEDEDENLLKIKQKTEDEKEKVLLIFIFFINSRVCNNLINYCV